MIKMYRLSDGNAIVGLDDMGFVKDALQVTMERDDEGNIKIGVVPLLFPFQTEHKGTDVEKRFCICEIPCPKELAEVYLQATTLVNMQVPTLERVQNP